jgi:hypothetical protein
MKPNLAISIVAVLLLPSSASALVIGRVFDPVESLEVRLFLEDSVFLEHERISTIVCVTNRGSKLLPAVTRPAYFCGYFDFILVDVVADKRMRRGYHSCGFMYGAWDLQPGESLCDVSAVASHFGGSDFRGDTYLSEGMGESALNPGRYRLSAWYPVRLPQDREHRRFTLVTAPVPFRVDSLASAPSEMRLAEEFDANGPFPRIANETVRDLCVRWLPRFYETALFDKVYWRARNRRPLPPPDSLFQDLRALKMRPFRKAIIANTYLTLSGGSNRPGLVDSLVPYLHATPGPEVLSSYRVGPMRTIR